MKYQTIAALIEAHGNHKQFSHLSGRDQIIGQLDLSSAVSFDQEDDQSILAAWHQTWPNS